jgi:hypothetical protein
MRRWIVTVATSLLFVLGMPAGAAAQSGGAAAPDASGGAGYGTRAPGPRLVARSFSVSPGTIRPGRALTVQWRVDGYVRSAQVRVDVVPARGGPVAATLRLGHRRTNRGLRVRWNPKLAPGTYTARLRATAVRARQRGRVTSSKTVRVNAPPVPAPPAPAPPAAAPPATAPHSGGVFPVQGVYSLGGADARFGATRTGHIHQGQDVIAAQGTPVVSVRAGSVTWRAYQGNGAGYYLVVHGDDGRDYVFMHLQEGSITVTKGQAVAAGQRIGAVGSTGASDGPHLHFEIWPQGWYADGSKPIDPLPDLQAWAR